MIDRPKPTDGPEYYQKYYALVPENNLIDALGKSLDKTLDFFASIPKGKENVKYAEGKWNVKEVISHIIDTERILTYRALCISRKDTTMLPGFDEKKYAPNSNTEERSVPDLAEEFIRVREATVSLFEYMSDEMLDFKGNSNNAAVTPRAIGWMIAGHANHHCKVIKEKYL